MTCVGTLKANRKGIPKHLKEIRNRPEGDYQVVYEEGTHKSLHSWVTNTKSGPKNIMIITTTCPIIGKTKDDNMEKPALYKRYDFAMGGTDRCDQLSESKTVRIKSRRWTLSPLCYMLDVSRVNARTVGLLQGGREILDTRNFARQLVRELVTPHIKRRLKKKGIQKFVKIKAECYLKKEKEGEDEEQEEEEQEEQEQEEGEQEEAESVQVEDPETPLRGTKRCSACLTLSENYKSSLNLKKSKTICRSCEKVFCMKHLLLTCSSCGGGPPPEQQGEQLPLQLIETLRGHLPRRVFQQLLLQLPRQPPHRGQQPLSQQLTSLPPHQPPIRPPSLLSTPSGLLLASSMWTSSSPILGSSLIFSDNVISSLRATGLINGLCSSANRALGRGFSRRTNRAPISSKCPSLSLSHHHRPGAPSSEVLELSLL